MIHKCPKTSVDNCVHLKRKENLSSVKALIFMPGEYEDLYLEPCISSGDTKPWLQARASLEPARSQGVTAGSPLGSTAGETTEGHKDWRGSEH